MTNTDTELFHTFCGWIQNLKH